MKKENFFIYNYKKCFKFLDESSWYIVFSLSIFMITFLIGFTFPVFFENEIKLFVEGLKNMLDGKSIPYLIGYIFLNNLKAAFFSLILGITFGIFPLLIAIVNGYLLGFVSRYVVQEERLLVLWRLFPHGIFELPAIILAIGIGIKIGNDLIKSKDKKKSLKHNYIEGMRFFFFVILPLLVVAAIIEGILVGLEI